MPNLIVTPLINYIILYAVSLGSILNGVGERKSHFTPFFFLLLF